MATFGTFGSQTIGSGVPSVPATPASVSALFGLIGQASSDAAQGISQGDIAAGDVNEANAYGNAAAIATANSRLALVGGDIEQAQEQIKLGQTIGSQKATVAANGFSSGGTALSLLRSSTRQGLLQQQITGVNADLQSGGFQEQAAASTAEGDAATAAAASATTLGANYNALSTATKTFAATQAAQMGLNVPGIANISGTSIPNTADLTPGAAGPNNGQPYVGNGGLVVPSTNGNTPPPAQPYVGAQGSLVVPPPATPPAGA